MGIIKPSSFLKLSYIVSLPIIVLVDKSARRQGAKYLHSYLLLLLKSKVTNDHIWDIFTVVLFNLFVI